MNEGLAGVSDCPLALVRHLVIGVRAGYINESVFWVTGADVDALSAGVVDCDYGRPVRRCSASAKPWHGLPVKASKARSSRMPRWRTKTRLCVPASAMMSCIRKRRPDPTPIVEPCPTRARPLRGAALSTRFARRKGKSFQVRVLNKTSGEGGIRNVRDAFSQRDWNTIKTEGGLKEFGVERVLAEHIDAEAASALEATRKHQFPLSRPDREALAMFMSAQLSRGRAVREGSAGSIIEVHRLLLRLGAMNYQTSGCARSPAKSRPPSCGR